MCPGSLAGMVVKLLCDDNNNDGFPGGSVVKNPPVNAGDPEDMDSISGAGTSPGGGNGNTLQYSCLENSTDRGAWQTAVQGLQRVRND